MNYLNEILSLPLFEAFGWTLIHTLWQGGVIVLILYLIQAVVGNMTSQVKYGLYLIALAGLTVCSIVTFVSVSHSIGGTYSYLSIEPQSLVWKSTGISSTAAFLSGWSAILSQTSDFVNANMNGALLAWFVGVTFLAIKMAGGFVYIQRWRLVQHLGAPDVWQDRLNQLAIKQKIRLLESYAVEAPVVFGYLKPVILMPVGIFSGLSISQVEAILAHELAHIKRNDYLINLLQSMVEIIYFFNPWVWLLSSQIRKEREYCCDDMAVQSMDETMPYIEALAMVEELRSQPPGLVLALSQNKRTLLQRIKRLVVPQNGHRMSLKKTIGLLVLAVILASFYWQTPNQKDRSQITELKSISLPEIVTGITPLRLSPILTEDDKEKGKKKNRKLKRKQKKLKQLENEVEELQGQSDYLHRYSAPKKFTFNYQDFSDEFETQWEDLQFVIDGYDEKNYRDENTPEGEDAFFSPRLHFEPKIALQQVIPSEELMAFVLPFQHSWDPGLYPVDTIEETPDWPVPPPPPIDSAWAASMRQWSKDFNATMEIHREKLQKQQKLLEEQLENLQFHFDHLDIEENYDYENQRQQIEVQVEQMQEYLEDIEIDIQKRVEVRLKGALADHEEEFERLELEMEEYEDKIEEFQDRLAEELVKDGYLENSDQGIRFEMKNGKAKANGKNIKRSI